MADRTEVIHNRTLVDLVNTTVEGLETILVALGLIKGLTGSTMELANNTAVHLTTSLVVGMVMGKEAFLDRSLIQQAPKIRKLRKSKSQLIRIEKLCCINVRTSNAIGFLWLIMHRRKIL